MAETRPPEPVADTTIRESPRFRCPKCQQPVHYVLARIGGNYSYQPCGHLGGKASR